VVDKTEAIKTEDVKTVDVTPVPAPEAKPLSEAELMKAIAEASTKGDYKAVAKIAQQLVTFQKAKETAEAAAKTKALEAITLEVNKAIKSALMPFYDARKLDKADGVWFSWDFGDNVTSTKLSKVAIRKSTGGGGGKKFDINTKDVIDRKYADTEYKDGMTFSQAWEHSSDKNWRYAIRQRVLKLEGLVS